MIKLECKSGIIEVELSGTPNQIVEELAGAILAINDRFNQKSPIPIQNHFWVAVSEEVNDILLERSKNE